MAEVPSWVPAHAGLTIAVYLAHFFINLDGEGLFQRSGTDIFSVLAGVLDFVFLQGVALPEWFSALLFMIVALPWFMWIASLVFGTTVGTVAGLIAGLIGGIGSFFSGLF